MKIKKEVTIIIQGFNKKGWGFGEYIDSVGRRSAVDVKATLPKEKVRVLLQNRRKKVYSADIVDIEEASELRIKPRCKHFDECGGCCWQHIDYEHQLLYKEVIIKNLFSSYFKDIECNSIVACRNHWHYRNKMEFSFSQDKAGNKYLGLVFKRGKVVNLEECHLVDDWFIEALKLVRSWWLDSSLLAYHAMKRTGTLQTLILREGVRTGEKMAILTVSGDPDYAINKNQLNKFVELLKRNFDKISIFIVIKQIATGKQTQFFEMHLNGKDHITEKVRLSNKEELLFKISPSAFFQPNTEQSCEIYERALQLANINENDFVYDLYCGTGVLGVFAAKKARKVLGVELAPEAVLDAKENISNNKIDNYDIHCGDVGKVLTDLMKDDEFERPDIVMIDPPRSGLTNSAIDNIVRCRANKIIYISCNPRTQLEDVKVFVDKGYILQCIEPIDQFPQTVHIENIVCLSLA